MEEKRFGRLIFDNPRATVLSNMTTEPTFDVTSKGPTRIRVQGPILEQLESLILNFDSMSSKKTTNGMRRMIFDKVKN